MKYAYRFKYEGAAIRHISVIRRPTEDGVTIYVNKRSASDISFPNDDLRPTRVTKTYPRGSKGRTGDAGLSSAAAGLPTLNPKNNDVLRLTVPSEEAFRRLLAWYLGKAVVEEKKHADVQSIVATTELPSPVDGQLVLPIDGNALKGSGYEPDQEIRKAVELYAVAKARGFYEDKRRGYSVTEKGKPYDLLCEKSGEILHVEVKGSRYALAAIIVTINEIEDARNSGWNSDLFLVEKIVLGALGPDGYKPSEGNCLRKKNWTPEQKDLTAIVFRYKLPPIPDAE